MYVRHIGLACALLTLVAQPTVCARRLSALDPPPAFLAALTLPWTHVYKDFVIPRCEYDAIGSVVESLVA